jgi:hypothetical protein
MRAAPLLAAVLLVLGCEERGPVGRAEAISDGDSYQLAQGLAWGAPIEELPPSGNGGDGQRWWQLRYLDGAKPGEGARILIVDAHSGWTRQPFPGYVVRATAEGPPAPAAAGLVAGPWILLLSQPAVLSRDAAEQLDAEAGRLNAQAAGTGLYPLFSAHQDDHGRWALVYGWQGGDGIQRDQRVSDWLSAHTRYGAGIWVDLRA